MGVNPIIINKLNVTVLCEMKYSLNVMSKRLNGLKGGTLLPCCYKLLIIMGLFEKL